MRIIMHEEHLANAEDVARHDSAARVLGWLARTFPVQIEALNRYRSHATYGDGALIICAIERSSERDPPRRC